MTLDLYLIRCQRNALWAGLPLAALAAIAVVVVQVALHTQETFNQWFALLPLACVLVALTCRLVANAEDLVQRVIAPALALLGMTAFVMAMLWGSGSPDVLAIVLAGLVPAVWSLVAAASIPCRPRATGRLAGWRLALVVLLAGVFPVAVAATVDPDAMLGGSIAALLLGGPVAFALACARSGPPLRAIVTAACMGGVVGGVIDFRTDAEDAPNWAVEFALLYALAAAAAHVASRARGMTAVRALDGTPVRLPWIEGDPDATLGRLGRALVGIGSAFVAAGWWFVARSETPAGPPARPIPLQSIGLGIEYFPQMAPGAVRLAAGPAGCVGLPSPDANAGIELVFAAFAKHHLLVGGSDEPPNGDTDGDASPGSPRREFLDAWGNPFVWFDVTDYAAAANGAVYVRGDGVRVTVSPRRDAAKGTYLRQFTFQLFSMGPDGLPGTADDIHYGE